MMLERLHRAKLAKCKFMESKAEYLIDKDGIHATSSKLKAITEAPPPKNVQELRSFLGLLNYYTQLGFYNTSS